MSNAPVTVRPGRVDAHHHLWDPAVRPQPWLDPPSMDALRRRFDLADLAAVAVPCGVTATVLVQVLDDESEARDFLAVAAHPGTGVPRVAGVVGWVDLTATDVTERIAALREAPGGDRLVGIRHLVQAEADPRWLTRPDVVAGLLAVAAAGLVFDLLVLPHQIAAAVEVVHAVPDGRFVLDHLGKPPAAQGLLEPWSAGVRELAATGRTAVKLSGLVTETAPRRPPVPQVRPYVEVALDAFGADRVMIGSDWPVCLLRGPYADALDLADTLTDHLSPTELTAVRGATATRWYGLRPAAALPTAGVSGGPARPVEPAAPWQDRRP